MSAPDRGRLRAAAARAVAALHSLQRPGGELPTFTFRRADMAGATPYRTSIYTTTFAVHALRSWAAMPVAAATLKATGEHLRAERNGDGSWGYEGRATRRVPPDLDDTACAVAALLTLGDPPDLALFRLLWENEAAPGGPYYTWIGVNGGNHLLARQLDALVNANVVLCAALAGQALPGAVAYLLDVTQRDFAGASVYCLSPHLLLYALARACADGSVPELLPAVRSGVAACRVVENALQGACLACGLYALGESEAAMPYMRALLAAQQPDGAWPIAAAYSGYPPHYDGSPALSTAIALEAISKALAAIEQPAPKT